jgi:hypothetical protein
MKWGRPLSSAAAPFRGVLPQRSEPRAGHHLPGEALP